MSRIDGLYPPARLRASVQRVDAVGFPSLQEILRRDWMFKLVGKETFSVGKSETKATITIDAVSGFAYEYELEINGKSLKKYMENRSKVTSTWILNLDGADCRVVLGKCHPHHKWNI